MTEFVKSAQELFVEVRCVIATNIDAKLDFYTQQQSYKHMNVLSQKRKIDLSQYLGLMVQKACLHLRLGQASHVGSIIASLFDILDDPSILGLPEEQERSPLTYQKPSALFCFDDEAAVTHFMAVGSNELVALQILF